MTVANNYQALHDWTLVAAVRAIELAAVADANRDPISAHNLRYAAALLGKVARSTKLRIADLAAAGEARD